VAGHGAQRARTAEGQGASLEIACGTLAPPLSSLAASGRAAKQGEGAWHFGAAQQSADCLVDRRPDQAVRGRSVAKHIACFRWAFQRCSTNEEPIFEKLPECFFEKAQRTG